MQKIRRSSLSPLIAHSKVPACLLCAEVTGIRHLCGCSLKILECLCIVTVCTKPEEKAFPDKVLELADQAVPRLILFYHAACCTISGQIFSFRIKIRSGKELSAPEKTFFIHFRIICKIDLCFDLFFSRGPADPQSTFLCRAAPALVSFHGLP